MPHGFVRHSCHILAILILVRLCENAATLKGCNFDFLGDFQFWQLWNFYYVELNVQGKQKPFYGLKSIYIIIGLMIYIYIYIYIYRANGVNDSA
jgi:hypothetical protein